MNILISNVCRVEPSKALTAYIEDNFSGAPVVLPADVLPPRQVRFTKGVSTKMHLKEHRGQWIITIERESARLCVAMGQATYEPQKALVFSREDYLSDKDVIADEKEFKRISDSDATHILVSIIGDSRSALAVCRNVVSGCQNPDKLVEDAKAALDASNVILIED